MSDLLTDAPPTPYIRYERETVTINGVTIHCAYWPYFPVGVDWSAVTDDYDGGETEPVGRGATKEAAIQDLLEQLED